MIMKKRVAVILMACLLAGSVMAGCSNGGTTESKAPSTSSAASKTEESKTESKADESKADESKTESKTESKADESKADESKADESKEDESAASAEESAESEEPAEGEESGEGESEEPTTENPYVGEWTITSYVANTGAAMTPEQLAATMEMEAGSMDAVYTFDAEGNCQVVNASGTQVYTYTISETGSIVVTDETGTPNEMVLQADGTLAFAIDAEGTMAVMTKTA